MKTVTGLPPVALGITPRADALPRNACGQASPSRAPLPGTSNNIHGEGPLHSLALPAIPPWLISANLHLAVLIALGLVTFTEQGADTVMLVANTAIDADEEFLELAGTRIGSVPDPAPQVSPLQPSAIDPRGQAVNEFSEPVLLKLNLPQTSSATEEATDEVLASVRSDATTDLGRTKGDESAIFFGTEVEGRRFVFVVDNSNSMMRGRFETVLNELSRTVDSLSASQQFYVIFYSDAAYRMFHPKPTTTYLAATDRNKERLRAWLYTVEMCFMTRGREALQIALKMQPDAIYVLGDGAFTDGAASMMAAPHNRHIPVHTIGMEVNARGASQLRQMADANNDTYREAHADVLVRRQAEQNPIKRNWSQGPVWGINLRR